MSTKEKEKKATVSNEPKSMIDRFWQYSINCIETKQARIVSVTFALIFFSLVRLLAKYTLAPLLKIVLEHDSVTVWTVDLLTSGSATYFVSSFLTERLIGLVFVLAWISTYRQLLSLVGERGILPAQDTMATLRRNGVSFSRFPCVFWFGTSDRFIRWTCIVGTLGAVAFMFDCLPALSLALSTFLYLSVKNIGMEFYALQWDALMVELGVAATLLRVGQAVAMFEPWLGTTDLPLGAALVYWCLWWLVFRLNFSSGIVKILSRDISWRDGSALNFHFWTQPLPSFPAWYARKYLPQWCHRFGVYIHFFIELVIPMGMFIPELHVPTALGLLSLQVGIAFTGNYGFFNIVTGILAVSMLPDYAFPSSLAAAIQTYRALNPFSFCHLFNPCMCSTPAVGVVVYAGGVAMGAAYVSFILLASLKLFESTFRGGFSAGQLLASWPSLEKTGCVSWARQYSLCNYYGLFARMTKYRHEIILEGSDDGVEWQEYRFRYKPSGPVATDGLRIVCPGHMPRLDWRLWFLPLGSYRTSSQQWFDSFLLKVLLGEERVLQALASNPFPNRPPRFVRASLWRYEFDAGEPEPEGKDKAAHSASANPLRDTPAQPSIGSAPLPEEEVEYEDLSPTWERGQGYWKRLDLKELYCPIATLSPDKRMRFLSYTFN